MLPVFCLAPIKRRMACHQHNAKTTGSDGKARTAAHGATQWRGHTRHMPANQRSLWLSTTNTMPKKPMETVLLRMLV
jgi:hypothetical protein